MLFALASDLAQRILTFNRIQTRRRLSGHLDTLGVARGDSVLDFGCCTGLNAGAFLSRGCRYVGYDIDERYTRLARRLHPRGRYTTDRREAWSAGPFDLVLAHCVFHHIEHETARQLLGEIRDHLAGDGVFLLIDLLREDHVRSALRRTWLKLEQGCHLRTAEEYLALTREHFSVEQLGTDRLHLFSLPLGINPVYNDVIVLACRRK